MSKCACSCEAAPKFVFSCSGAADVGEVADQAARELSRQGKIKMFCLAGIGGKVSGIVKSTEAADQIVAIDGCPLNCARKTLEEAGFSGFEHVELDGLGLKKGESPASAENIDIVVQEVSKRIQG
ncbi:MULTISPECIES: putative zinc-binding protein [unclassified Pseudodesulfovibrio]|uniref:putative zinc-binding protein n=1 Tax=unclassified Pseudodesulfovibrio TaxID=2661612 RepID=UPI000FEC1493|nr:MULTISPECIES: putative zinc-binding protein [unclassified Pseudodesulfovibrio]MCJ2165104.1 putative zinc-binding protein [Pseudodesulfovibrio sp. S3-i]RWU03431.1 zinc-binding protein [Pseudodesulfovibrio sp. S3]